MLCTALILRVSFPAECARVGGQPALRSRPTTRPHRRFPCTGAQADDGEPVVYAAGGGGCGACGSGDGDHAGRGEELGHLRRQRRQVCCPPLPASFLLSSPSSLPAEIGHGPHSVPVAALCDCVLVPRQCLCCPLWADSCPRVRSVLVWDLATQAPTAGPQCPAPITSLLYVEQWLLCGLQTGGITAHHTGGSGGAVELAGHTGAVSSPRLFLFEW